MLIIGRMPIANHLPLLRSIVLPRGIYNIADGIPPNDTVMVAAGVVDAYLVPVLGVLLVGGIWLVVMNLADGIAAVVASVAYLIARIRPRPDSMA